MLEHMVLRTLQPGGIARFGLEDVFTAGNADKVTWVNGWRKLPHVDPEVQELYAYPAEFAEKTFERVEQALRTRASGATVSTGRLFVVTEPDSKALPDVPVRHIRSSDAEIVAAQKAEAHDHAELLSDRLEGHFVVSYETSGGWVAISKDVLTDVLGAGRDAKVAGLPRAAVETLKLMCRGLVVVP